MVARTRTPVENALAELTKYDCGQTESLPELVETFTFTAKIAAALGLTNLE
jgi:hypothetical protein